MPYQTFSLNSAYPGRKVKQQIVEMTLNGEWSTRCCQGFARQHLNSDEGTKKTRSPQTRQSKAIKSTPARASRGNI